MKVIIDIDEKEYKYIKSVIQFRNGDTFMKIAKDLINAVAEGKPCREHGSLPYDDDKTTCMVCHICGSVWEVNDDNM